jgi:hypothetical protein
LIRHIAQQAHVRVIFLDSPIGSISIKRYESALSPQFKNTFNLHLLCPSLNFPHTEKYSFHFHFHVNTGVVQISSFGSKSDGRNLERAVQECDGIRTHKGSSSIATFTEQQSEMHASPFYASTAVFNLLTPIVPLGCE